MLRLVVCSALAAGMMLATASIGSGPASADASLFDRLTGQLPARAAPPAAVVRRAPAKPQVRSVILRRGGGFYTADMMYQVRGVLYASDADEFYSAEGQASWYGPGFHGKRTANGEIYDMTALTAAHKTLPLPSIVRVTNLDNGREILVRVNDRGPFIGDRMIDLSHASAQALGTVASGVGRVRVDYVGVAPLNGDDRIERAHLAAQSWSTGTAAAVAGAAVPAPAPRPNVIATAIPDSLPAVAVAVVTGSLRTAAFTAPVASAVLSAPVRATRPVRRPSRQQTVTTDTCWPCRDADRP